MWYKPVISATQETEVGDSQEEELEGPHHRPGQKRETLSEQ
jgi:hypothetical protein